MVLRYTQINDPNVDGAMRVLNGFGQESMG